MPLDRDQLRTILSRPFLLAVLAFTVLCLRHWITLPIYITYDGHEYILLADLLGTDRFWEEWNPIRTPGFPLALKVSLSILGRNSLAAQSVPVALGALGCLLVADSVRRILGQWAAAITLLVLGFFPTLVAFEHVVLTETGTFFFLALLVRLGVWAPTTVRDAWLRALAFALALTAGYFWRQTVIVVAPWLALLQAVTVSRLIQGRRRYLIAALQIGLVLLLPLASRLPWTSRFPHTNFGVRLLLDFAMRQAVVPPEDPLMAPIAYEYRLALAAAEREGMVPGIPWPEVSRLGALIALEPTAQGARWQFVRLIAKYPTRYAVGVGRTLRFVAGFDGGKCESKNMRWLILSPASTQSLIGGGPEQIVARNTRDFTREAQPGTLRRALWWLSGPYDRLLMVCNLLTVGLFLVALVRRDQALLAVSGVPVIFALAHAVLLISMDRFMVPIYPLTLACGILTVFLAAGRWRQAKKGGT